MGDTSANPELDVSRLPDGEFERLFSRMEEGQGGLSVQISEVSEDGAQLIIHGSVLGKIGPSDNFGRDIDLGDPLDFKADFNVVVVE